MGTGMTDWVIGQMHLEDDDGTDTQQEAAYYYEVFDGRPDELVRLTSRARDTKTMGIRLYYAEHGKLSEKQRWCLAFWLATHNESRHHNYALSRHWCPRVCAMLALDPQRRSRGNSLAQWGEQDRHRLLEMSGCAVPRSSGACDHGYREGVA